jgi:hypothetical protein
VLGHHDDMLHAGVVRGDGPFVGVELGRVEGLNQAFIGVLVGAVGGVYSALGA